MKKIILLTATLLSATFSFAQKFEWLAGTEGTTIPGSIGSNGLNQSMVATDASGNIYLYGSYAGTLILGNDTLTSYGLSDLFLAKMNAAGSYLWVEAIGTNAFDDGLGFAIDGASNIYITSGSSASGIMFTRDSAVGLSSSQYNLLSFDSSGAFRWVKTGYGWYNLKLAATLNGSGVYLVHSATVDKMDGQGNITWQKTVSSVPSVIINISAVAVNDNDKLVFAVSTSNLSPVSGTLSFDTVNTPFSNAQSARFIFECDTSGSALWGREFSGNSSSSLNISTVRVSNITGDVYAGMSSGNSVYFFANDTIVNPVNPGQGWGAALKFDSQGAPQWARAFYAVNAWLYDMTINSSDEVIFCGSYNNSNYCIFGPFNLPAQGSTNPFIGKLNSTGNFMWAKIDPRTVNNMSESAINLINIPGNNYLVGGIFSVFFINPFFQGCHSFTPGTYLQGHYFVSISENAEPVPLVDFSILQSANKVLFKDQTQNAVSFQWDFGDASTSLFAEPIHDYAQPGVYNVCLSASNNCGTNQLCKTVVIKGIRAMVTDHGSQGGVVTADILGGGFTSTTTVLLKKSGSPDIIPYFTKYINDGKLQVRLDLTSQTLGLWDVEVTVPADTIMTLVNGFRIDSAFAYQFEVTYEGPSAARPNRWIPSKITIHNKSNQDAAGVAVFYRLDESWNTYLNAPFISPQQIPFLNSGYQYLVSNGINTALTDFTFSDSTFNSTHGAFIIPLLKANASYKLPLFIRGTISIVSGKVTSAGGALLESSSLLGSYAPSPFFCFSELFKSSIERTFSISIPGIQWNSCFPALYDSLLRVTCSQANDSNNYSVPFSLPAGVVSMLAAIASSGCIPGVPSVLSEAEIKSVIVKTLHNVADSTEVQELIQICPALSQFRVRPSVLPAPQSVQFQLDHTNFCAIECVVAGVGAGLLVATGFPFMLVPYASAIVSLCIMLTASVDPNYISGPGNNADDIFLKPGNISSYTIEFENADTATAAAQVVLITDTLDASRFDFSTFRFASVTIGDSLKFEFDEPGNSQLKLSSLAPFSSDYLRTEATFDTTSGIIQWIFTTVDPVNYQPDTNVLAGFLPPNVNGTEGTGYVSYDVRLKSTLVTGDSINNTAQIIFDSNAPVITNNWLNVIDIDKPQSAVNPLPPNVNTTSFLVSWSGTDFIAGVKSYSIYVSENDQPYYLWLAATDTNQFTYTGVFGSKYEFISIAMDNAGNVEDAPVDPENFPDAVTTVVTGLDEISGDLNFSLYPNPVTNELFIHCNSSIDGIKVSDVVGKEIYAQKTFKPSSAIELQTFSFDPGIYFLEITSGHKKGVIKFVKTE